MNVSARTLGLASIAAVVFGMLAIFVLGGVTVTTAGVVAVILGVIALLLATGLYIGQDQQSPKPE